MKKLDKVSVAIYLGMAIIGACAIVASVIGLAIVAVYNFIIHLIG